jgi:hypothetical protein
MRLDSAQTAIRSNYTRVRILISCNCKYVTDCCCCYISTYYGVCAKFVEFIFNIFTFAMFVIACLQSITYTQFVGTPVMIIIYYYFLLLPLLEHRATVKLRFTSVS